MESRRVLFRFVVAQIDLHDLVAGHAAAIGDRDGDGDALPRPDRRLRQDRRAEVELRVAEPEAEGPERGRFVEQIAAMRARLVIVEDRELTDVARDGDGQLAAGIDAPEQRVGDGIALLLAGVPCFEDRVGPCGNRSEEHTSELQSLMRNSYAVLCLKKKKDIRQT